MACQICEKECPPRCIHIEKSKDKKPDFVGKQQFYPAVFDIDVAVCMSCQICVEVCPFDAIRMDKVYELSTSDRFGGLLWTKEQLSKPNEYYQKIHPMEAAETDERREKELAEAQAKAAAAAAKAAQTAQSGTRRRIGEWRFGSRKAGDGGARMISAGAVDQVFVTLKDWIVMRTPAPLQTLVSIVIEVATIIVVFAALFALTTVFERKGLGRMQNRYGPNRVGPFGVFQPMADAVKSLTKEDVVPRAADHVVHYLAPLVLVGVVFLAYAVLPVGRNMTAVNLDAGVLYFFAVGAATELAVFMAGWSSHNKYSLLGAMRAIAQMVSYEIPLILSSVAVIMIAGTLSTVKIVELQARYSQRPRALVCVHAVGAGGVHPVYDRGDGGDESEPVRSAGRRVGDYRRLFHRVFGVQVCAVLPGRVSGDVRGERAGDHAVSGRMVVAGEFSGVDSVVDLVLRQAAGADLRVHLGARHGAAPAHGSADELRVEIHAADDAGGDSFGRHLALSHGRRGGAEAAGRCDTLAGLCTGDFCAVYNAGARAGARPEDREESLSLRGIAGLDARTSDGDLSHSR